MKGKDFTASIQNVMNFYADVASAGEYAGMGLCVTFYSMVQDKDSTKEFLAQIHTGESLDDI